MISKSSDCIKMDNACSGAEYMACRTRPCEAISIQIDHVTTHDCTIVEVDVAPCSNISSCGSWNIAIHMSTIWNLRLVFPTGHLSPRHSPVP